MVLVNVPTTCMCTPSVNHQDLFYAQSNPVWKNQLCPFLLFLFPYNFSGFKSTQSLCWDWLWENFVVHEKFVTFIAIKWKVLWMLHKLHKPMRCITRTIMHFNFPTNLLLKIRSHLHTPPCITKLITMLITYLTNWSSYVTSLFSISSFLDSSVNNEFCSEISTRWAAFPSPPPWFFYIYY